MLKLSQIHLVGSLLAASCFFVCFFFSIVYPFLSISLLSDITSYSTLTSFLSSPWTWNESDLQGNLAPVSGESCQRRDVKITLQERTCCPAGGGGGVWSVSSPQLSASPGSASDAEPPHLGARLPWGSPHPVTEWGQGMRAQLFSLMQDTLVRAKCSSRAPYWDDGSFLSSESCSSSQPSFLFHLYTFADP